MDNNLYDNLAWYVDDNRFQGIVSELEQKADQLEKFEGFNSEDENKTADYKQKYRAFRKAVLLHAKKSGYSQKHPEVLDVNKFFFAGSKINRKALEGFEKDIVKDHMYQKHLWEFMGTTGHLSLVSKLALAANGKKADDLTPISEKGKRVQTSPISPILSEIPDSVPLYLYSDGTVSTLYDKNRAKLTFDTTEDKTGFDWKRTGWDPNYDIEHKDLKIVFNPKTGEYTAVKTSGGTLAEEVVQIFTPEKASPLNMKVILAENEGAILNDPFYIFVYKKLYEIILQNKKLSEEEEDYRDELLALIDRGLEAVGADKITAIVRSSDNAEEVNDKQVIKAYREILGDRVAPSVRLISSDDAANVQAKSLDKVIARRDEQAGVNLASKLAYLAGLGLSGPALSRAVKTSTMAQNANFLSLSDLKEAGFEDEDARAISKFEVPLDKQPAFSKVLFNLMDDYSLLSAAGLGERKIADLVYDSIVGGNKHNEYIELPLTLERICTTKSTIFDGEVKANVRKAFEDELATLPAESRTKRLEEKVNNAVLRYKVIKEASGMSETEVVSQLVKTSEVALAPVPTIRYMSSSDPTSQKFTVRLKFSDIIDSTINSDKVVTFIKPIDFTNIQTKARYNLFDAADLAKWLRSSIGKKSGLDEETLSNLVSSLRNTTDDSVLSPILQNRVTAEFAPTIINVSTSGQSTADVNPLFLGLSLLKKVDPSLSTSLKLNTLTKDIESSSIQNKVSLETAFKDIPLQFANKTSTETPENQQDENLQNPNQQTENQPNSTPEQAQIEQSKDEGLSDSDKLKIGLGVAGGVVGLAGVGGIIYGIWSCYNNNKKKAQQASQAAQSLDSSSDKSINNQIQDAVVAKESYSPPIPNDIQNEIVNPIDLQHDKDFENLVNEKNNLNRISNFFIFEESRKINDKKIDEFSRKLKLVETCRDNVTNQYNDKELEYAKYCVPVDDKDRMEYENQTLQLLSFYNKEIYNYELKINELCGTIKNAMNYRDQIWDTHKKFMKHSRDFYLKYGERNDDAHKINDMFNELGYTDPFSYNAKNMDVRDDVNYNRWLYGFFYGELPDWVQ